MAAENWHELKKERLLEIFFAHGGTVTERGFKKPSLRTEDGRVCGKAIENIKNRPGGKYMLGKIKDDFCRGQIDCQGKAFVKKRWE